MFDVIRRVIVACLLAVAMMAAVSSPAGARGVTQIAGSATAAGGNGAGECDGATSLFTLVLEGDLEVIESLYDVIESDRRHADTRVLLREDAEVRAFGDWTMGFVQADREMLASVAGLNDFLQSQRGAALIPDEQTARVEKLLDVSQKRKTPRRLRAAAKATRAGPCSSPSPCSPRSGLSPTCTQTSPLSPSPTTCAWSARPPTCPLLSGPSPTPGPQPA